MTIVQTAASATPRTSIARPLCSDFSDSPRDRVEVILAEEFLAAEPEHVGVDTAIFELLRPTEGTRITPASGRELLIAAPNRTGVKGDAGSRHR